MSVYDVVITLCVLLSCSRDSGDCMSRLHESDGCFFLGILNWTSICKKYNNCYDFKVIMYL